MAPAEEPTNKRNLALIIPAHDEELVLAGTILSALSAGAELQDIYVVDDASHDETRRVAVDILDPANVITVPWSGKAKAIRQAITQFDIPSRYVWMHIADADGHFGPGYFKCITSKLDPKYAAATGHVQSLKGGWISKYRVLEYTIGLEIIRRIQAFFGVIAVIPGPSSVFRTDVLKHLDFATGTLTEDMDLTFQIHRKHLGPILYIPEAKTFTQDPKDFHDYYKQLTRWYRGNFQVMRRHKIGRRGQRLDVYVSYVLLEQLILMCELIILPFSIWWSQNVSVVFVLFLSNLVLLFCITVWAAILNRRPDILAAFPLFCILQAVNIFVFMKAWYEVGLRGRFETVEPGWATAGRRYVDTISRSLAR